MKKIIKSAVVIIAVCFSMFISESSCFADTETLLLRQSDFSAADLSSVHTTYQPNMNGQLLLADRTVNPNLMFASQEESTADNSPFLRQVGRDIRHAWDVTLSDFKYIYSSPTRIDKRSALWIGGFFALGGVIFAYDQEIYDAIHRNKNHKLYKPFMNLGEACEDLGYMGFTNKYFFAALFTGYLIKNETMMNISADILESFGVAALGKNSTMWGVGRYGPALDMGPRHFRSFDGRSMPSGHSSAVMQFSTVAANHIDYLPFKIVAYTCATSVLFQRITSDHHWPSDVYVGATFGRLIAKTISKRANERRLKVSPAYFNSSGGNGFQITYGF